MTDQPETWVSWTDDGVVIYCRKPSCMTDGKYYGVFDIPGFYLSPEMIWSAFYQHRVDHSS